MGASGTEREIMTMWKPAIIKDIQETRKTVKQMNAAREKLNTALKVGKRVAVGAAKTAGVGAAGYAAGKRTGKTAEKKQADDSWEQAAENVK